jgi:hypothetical protein
MLDQGCVVGQYGGDSCPHIYGIYAALVRLVVSPVLETVPGGCNLRAGRHAPQILKRVRLRQPPECPALAYLTQNGSPVAKRRTVSCLQVFSYALYRT